MSHYTIPDLINEYARQRKQNQTAVQALAHVFKLQTNFSAAEQQELSQKIRQWERDWQSGINNTATNSIENLPSIRATGTAPALSTSTSAQQMMTCPKCKSQNAVGSSYCFSCGEVFETAATFQTRQLVSEAHDKTFFSKDHTLLMWIAGYTQQAVKVKFPDEKPLMLGRSDPRALRQPDIDLKDYGGEKMGVSRQHAFLQRRDNTLTLVDKGSSNHSYINGERVRNNEVRILGDGDTLRFGNLNMRLTFQSETIFKPLTD